MTTIVEAVVVVVGYCSSRSCDSRVGNDYCSRRSCDSRVGNDCCSSRSCD